MNALFSSEPGETTTLRTWRERSLHFLLRLSLAFLLFPLLVDIIGSFQRGEIAHIYLDLGYYASFILLTFFQRIPFHLRVASLLGLGLSFHTYILMSTGLVSVGRLGILTDVVLAALLLGRVSAIFVWILGLLATGLGLMLFQLQPPDTIVQFTSRLRDPNTLFTQGLFTMSLSGILGGIVLWLFNRINERLCATEQALAERTAQLREALEDLHATEVKYTTLFQVMPAGITIIDNHGHIREYNNTVQQISQYSYLTSEHIQALAQSCIRPDGTPLPVEEYPGMRVLQEHRTIADIEIGIVAPGADTTWISVTAAPIDLTGYGAVIVCNDITARKNAEQTLKRQLQIQAAIARSSQILLGPAPTAADQQQLLIAALETLYETNSINPIYLSHNIDDPQLGLCAWTVSHIGHSYAVEPHPLIQQAPWSVLPNEIYHALATGNLWTGLLPSVLPQQPGLQQIVETYEVQSVLCFPITVDAKWWGTISFTDPRPDRIWSDHEILILRTTAKMIGTAIQRWQTETSLSQQLRYAEALARCSQLLLQPGGDASTRQPLVEAVLHTLREATTASHILVYKHNVPQRPKESFNILGSVHTADIAPLIIPTTEQLSDIPTEVLEKFKLGQSFSGPVVGRFPDNPHFQQTFDQNGILSMLMIPIALDGRHWGMIEATDCLQARTWDAPSIQLLRTAVEMLATTQQGWAATQILAEREHFIQQVMQATPNIIHVFDLDSWRTIYSNRPFTSLIGYPSELLEVGGTVMMPLLLSPEDQERLTAYYHQLAENSETHAFDIEYRIKLGDGQTRWVLSRDQVFMRDEAGCARQILSMCQDITERKAAEHALATSEAQLRALRDALPDLMFILHVDGTILDYHVPPHTYLLFQPEDFLGKSLDTQMPPNIAQPARNAIHQVLAKGGIETFEYNLLIDGRQFAYEARIVHIVGDTCLCIIHDITARHEAAAALVRAKDSAEAADRAKSTFLAHISHEIRTPLTAIIGMASLLLESNLSTSQHENAAIIRTAGEALLSLIGNILDFSKIEAGQLELATQPFDMRTTCRIAIDLVYHAAAHKGLTLDWKIDPHVPAIVIGDGGRLRQVLVNLLSNAIKFTERGDVWLTVHSRTLETDVCEAQFTVRDTGIGIAPDKLVQIFKPFVQVDHVLTRKTGGTGLGLAISQQLVELMGGRLEVESAFGFGTTFTLILPLGVAVACPAQPEEKVMSAPLTALRILIAEDNPINQEVLRRMLEQLGTLPTVVSDGKAALVAVSDAPFDLVLMDIQMPILDGEAATKQIRKLGTAIVQPRIIALTASALRGDRERYLEAGMDDYLSKPVQLEDLRRLLVPLNTVAPPVAPSVSPLLRLSGTKSAAEVNAQLDWSTVERLLGSLEMPRDQAAMLVCDLYERELPIQLTALSAAIEAEDRIQAARLAHKLRGGSRQLGALALASACATLEATAKDVHNPTLVDQLKQVHQIYNETLALIQYRLRISA